MAKVIRPPTTNQTATRYALTRLAVQRGLAFIYLLGFLIALNQFGALLGAHGLLPVPLFLQRVRFWDAPSLLWFHYSDPLATVLAWIGLLLGLAALTGLSERYGTTASMTVWALMWVLYQSFVNVGQTWYAFGWETLLLEAGFLAIFLGARHTAPPTLVIWLLRWVLFRVMFGAALIKLRGDPCWRNLTCLAYHYETQPIPNPLSWYLHQAPLWFHKLGALFTHFVELIVPFGYFLPLRRIRHAAGGLTVAFQVMLILSGNLSWLNYLTIVLALSCFDDALLHHLFRRPPPTTRPLARWHRHAALGLTVLVAVLSVRPAVNLLSAGQLMNASFEPFHLVNTYGAFGSVTRERLEIVIEGTPDSTLADSTVWTPYEFKAKPGNPSRMPPVVSPYHLRLDWLMWFAAMSPYYQHPWVLNLMAKLLAGDRATLGLMAGDPFPGKPPYYVRAQLYRYRFTDAEERRRTGQWWSRTVVGEFLPPLTLADPSFRAFLEQQGWR